MAVNEVENNCHNCISLKAQCDDLRSELGRLNLRLDEIVRSLSCDKISAYTQTAITLGESQEDSDILFKLYNTVDVVQSRSEVEPVDDNTNTSSTDPFILYQGQPFSSFSLDVLDKETNYTTILENRCVAYYGEFSYKYGNIEHPKKCYPYEQSPFIYLGGA